jgi:SSS family solute:Na+ symporter
VILNMKTADAIVFLLFMTGITVFGASFYRKNKSANAFSTGERSVPHWVVALSIFATYVSSISFLALPGYAYQANWNVFVFSLSIPFATIVAVKFFIPLYRQINSPSAYTYLEIRFGVWARIYVSLCYLLTQLMRIGTILYLLALSVNAVFEWNITMVIILTGILVMIYAVLGGFQAVVWTDAIQAIILITGAVICAVYLILKMPEGPLQLFSIASTHHKFSLGSFSLSISESTFWVVLIYGTFINLQNFGIDQNYVQRFIASKTDRHAKYSAFLGSFLYIPVSMIFLFIGTALFVYYSMPGNHLPPSLSYPTAGDRIFPYFIVTELPAGISGLLIASVFSAGMSTVSTSFNSSATVFLTDYYQKFVKRKITEKESLRVLYISTLITGLLGIVIGIAMIDVKSVLDTWWKLASVFSGGMLGLFLLGTFSKKTDSKTAVPGVIAGILIILWFTTGKLIFGEKIPGANVHTYLTIVFGTAAIFFIGFLLSLLGNKSKK